MSLERFRRFCLDRGYDPEVEIERHARTGVFYCGPDCILVAEAREREWFIFYAAGQGWLPRFMQIAPFRLDQVTWLRDKTKRQAAVDWSRLKQILRSKPMGGRPKAPQQVQQEPPPPIPPVTETRREVMDADREARQGERRRRGHRSTILAGAGGAGRQGTPFVNPMGQRTLLGINA